MDAWRQRGEITVRSDWKAWTRCPPDSPPSAGPAAPVVFQKRDVQEGGGGGSKREGGVRRGVSFTPCDSGESEQAQRGSVKAEQGLCKGAEGKGGGSYAMSQP